MFIFIFLLVIKLKQKWLYTRFFPWTATSNKKRPDGTFQIHEITIESPIIPNFPYIPSIYPYQKLRL